MVFLLVKMDEDEIERYYSTPSARIDINLFFF